MEACKFPQEVSVLLPENERLDSCQWQDKFHQGYWFQFLDGQDLANSYKNYKNKIFCHLVILHSSMIGETMSFSEDAS